MEGTSEKVRVPEGTRIPEQYFSVRITIDHDKFSVIEKNVIYDYDWYICYPHTGNETEKQHFHCLLPGHGKAAEQRIRDRVARHIGVGNAVYCLKHFENGVVEGIGYCLHERGEPFTRGDVQSWIAAAVPKVKESDVPVKKRKRCLVTEDVDGETFVRGYPLNKYNIVDQAVHVYHKQRFTHKSWRQTIGFMVDQGNKYRWHFTETMDCAFELDFLNGIQASESRDNFLNKLIGFDFSSLP